MVVKKRKKVFFIKRKQERNTHGVCVSYQQLKDCFKTYLPTYLPERHCLHPIRDLVRQIRGKGGGVERRKKKIEKKGH